MMGLGRVLAEGHDRVEGESLGSLIHQQGLELPGHLLLADPHREVLEDPVERGVGDRLRPADRGALLVVLHRAQGLDDLGRRDELDIGERVGEPIPRRDGHLLRLEPETGHAVEVPGQLLAKWVQIGHALQIGDLAAGLLRVAPVGEEQGAVTPHEHLSVGPGEPREVARVQQSRDQQRIDGQVFQTRGQRVPPYSVIHGIASSAR